MLENLDENAIRAAFAQPNNDGSFPEAFRDYLRALGMRRPSVILAFPPKAAGTFLRTAAIVAVEGQLIRAVHAQGGRDAQPYLPMFLSYLCGEFGEAPLVTHMHLQALPANRHFFDALGLRPVIMLRSITDMLASYRDMLDADPAARADGLNCTIPAGYSEWSKAAKSEFLIDVLAPWYVGYYATWLDYARAAPGRVCMLTYRDFLDSPAETLSALLDHADMPVSRAICDAAIAETWAERGEHRFNLGECGRGRLYFTAEQAARLRQMLSYYPILREREGELL
ncbi:MAG TPA: hypothetical protein VMF58_10070 [Rhizomicrobium sp.]|nr:hypothetical protein [Rhizomicrobium sp.]